VTINHIFIIFISILLQLHLRQLANMPNNDKAREKKVTVAVNALVPFTGMKVHEAIFYTQFSKKEINDVNVRHVTSAFQSHGGRYYPQECYC
jgi:hypothetical protein